MSNTIAYLTSRSNFVQVSPEVPITKQRNPEKYDAPDVFEGVYMAMYLEICRADPFIIEQTKRNLSQTS